MPLVIRLKPPHVSAIAGVFFGIGWGLFIDSVAYSNHVHNNVDIVFGFWMPGIAATLFLLMMMPISSKAIGNTDAFSGGSPMAARLWMLVAFVLGLGSVM